MITYADGFHSHSVIGISLVVGSASTAALYKVKLDAVLYACESTKMLHYFMLRLTTE